MSMRSVVRSLAIGRIVFGAAMLLSPETAVRGWIGRQAASKAGTQVVTRAFGARDLVLGAGTLAALGSGDARDWVLAGGACDVVDLVATLRADGIPAVGKVAVAALASTAVAISAGYLIAGDSSS